MVILGLHNEREQEVFCRAVLEWPELAGDPRFSSSLRRAAKRQELATLIVASLASRSAEQLIPRFDAAQIANARMNHMHEVPALGQYTHAILSELDWDKAAISLLRRAGAIQEGAVML